MRSWSRLAPVPRTAPVLAARSQWSPGGPDRSKTGIELRPVRPPSGGSRTSRPGDLLAPTSLLSNLGVIDEPIRFGAEAGDVTHLWFSPPAKMPYGLAIGTVTYCSRLHISLRYRHPLFSGDAARSFAGTYVEALKAVSAAAPGCADAIRRRQ